MQAGRQASSPSTLVKQPEAYSTPQWKEKLSFFPGQPAVANVAVRHHRKRGKDSVVVPVDAEVERCYMPCIDWALLHFELSAIAMHWVAGDAWIHPILLRSLRKKWCCSTHRVCNKIGGSLSAVIT